MKNFKKNLLKKDVVEKLNDKQMNHLKGGGYNCGVAGVDGDFGRATEDALKKR